VPTPDGGVVDVTVPPSARGGMKLRLKERGLPGKPPGHLYLLLEIALPPARPTPRVPPTSNSRRPRPSIRASTWGSEP
jgi:DnaJ-class molecular chaperone